MVPAASRERSGEIKRTVGLSHPGAAQSFWTCVFPFVHVCKEAHIPVCDGLRLEHVCGAVEMKDSTGSHV